MNVADIEAAIAHLNNARDILNQLKPCFIGPPLDTSNCDTVFDCETSENSFLFNNGSLSNLDCGQTVPISLLWIGCDGERAPDDATVLVLTANGQSITFAGSNPPNPINNYLYTLPTTAGPHTITFEWGNTADPEPCSVTVTFDCQEIDSFKNTGIVPDKGDDYEASLLEGRGGAAEGVTGGAGQQLVIVSSQAEFDAALAAGNAWICFPDGFTATFNHGANYGTIGSNVTVDGRGANVTIQGNGYRAFGSSNIIIHNIKFDVNGENTALRFTDGASLYWLDHLDIINYADDGISVYESSTTGLGDATFSWLNMNGPGTSILIGSAASAASSALTGENFTIHHSLMDSDRRHPFVRYATVDVFNNVIEYDGNGVLVSDSGQVCATNNDLTWSGSGNAGNQISALNAISIGGGPTGTIWSSGNTFNNGAGTNGNIITNGSGKPSFPYTCPIDTDYVSKVQSNAGWQSVSGH